ncbi:MAG: hypothetical protein H7Z12_02320 [Rhodospirillaceae bacterium]|nr:hypothetical protein [Rhodospirillales bacterium]
MSQLGALAAVTSTLAALGGLGALAGGRGLRSADLVVGWGLVTIVLTLAGLAWPGSLSLTGWGCLGAGLLAAVITIRQRGLLPPSLPWVLVLALPLILMVTAMQPSQWDEFSQWLHSVRYLVENNAFPSRAGPVFEGSFAAYPFANSFPAFLASLLAGGFLENAGAIVNVFVCIVYCLVLAELMAEGSGRPQALRSPAVIAVALLAGTVGNPTFVPKVVFTAYADAPTALALTLVGVLGWRMLAALAEDDLIRARRLALQAGLVGATLLSLKQANLVLFLLALMGMAAVMLRDPALRRARSGLYLVMIMVPALLPYLAWRWHVTHQFPGAEFVVRPMAQWATDIVPEILARMGSVASNKGGHFTVLAVVLVLALRAMLRMRTGFDRLVVIAAFIALGYNAFLLFAYVTAFDRGEALSVASFWRYNMHVGPVAWAALIYGVATQWRWSLPQAARWALPALVLVAPLVTVKFFRFDLRAPKLYVRAVAAEMRPLLPEGARLSVVDPADSGFYALLMKYLQHGRASAVDRMYLDQPPDTPEAIGKQLGRFAPSHAWVHIPTDATRRVFGQPLPAGASYLLARDGSAGWTMVKSWPYPGYANPHDIRD